MYWCEHLLLITGTRALLKKHTKKTNKKTNKHQHAEDGQCMK